MHRSKPLSLLLCLISMLAFSPNADAQLKLASVFGDNMIIQRDMPVSVFGWAEVGEEVTVQLGTQSIKTKTGNDGRWIAVFAPIKLGEPFEIVAKGKSEVVKVSNCLAGEVWICSGQSNMEWWVKRSGNPKEEIANANYPNIRHLDIENRISTTPLDKAPNSGWKICNPENAGDFTAVGYYFARHLHRELDVPVGLINTTWGGTIVEAWTSAESLAEHPDFVEPIKNILAMRKTPDQEKIQREAAAAYKKAFDAIWRDDNDPWQAPDLDDADWKQINAPGNWERQGYPTLDGVAWYRKTIEIPQEMVGKPLTLNLAKVDDQDVTYVNGSQVGSINGWNRMRSYTVPAELVKERQLSIAVKVSDGSGGGGFHGDAKEMGIMMEGAPPVSLAGKWKFKVGSKTAALPKKPTTGFNGPNNPTALYNAMVNPLIPVSFKGAIWYQGESNASRAYQYRSLFPLMIQDWRQKWQRVFPFYWVQLASFTAPSQEPGPSQWAELREAQSMTLKLPKTGQAVTIDIGDARDIHPKNKQDVGKRLAIIALANDYGKQIVFSGPTFKAMKIEGDRARLSFEHAEGLKSSNGPLKRFEIAGADKKFHWADATIEGNEVIVRSDQVPAPVAVRYAWANNPEGCNVYNGADLPASPFRTDDWPGVTVPQK